MEREIWIQVTKLVAKTSGITMNGRFTFSVEQIVLTYFWSVLHDRPISWACRAEHWPNDLRSRALPSAPTMTRRLRTPAVAALLDQLHHRMRSRFHRGWLYVVDGKPLPIGGNSQDPDAGYGRGAGGKDKGYKLHVISGKNGGIRNWCVEPIQVSESKTAATLVRSAEIDGYLLGDSNYDSNPLYDVCSEHGIQLVAPRRYGANRGFGHHRHSPARLRAAELLEHSATGFGPALHKERSRIERQFGNMASASYGLGPLPAWVRRLPRVRRWVSAKIVIFMIVRNAKKRAA